MNYWHFFKACVQVTLVYWFVSCTSVDVTSTMGPSTLSAPTALSTVTTTPTQSAQEVISDPGTLKSCYELNKQQAGSLATYRDIIPGSTTDDEASLLLGAPKETYVVSHSAQRWVYDDFLVDFENRIVVTIYVYKDDLILKSLEEIIDSLGCPTIMYAIDSAEHPSGHYDSTWQIYNELGIEFRYDTYPIRKSQIPYVAVYSEHRSVDQYLQYWILGIDEKATPVSWNDAVQ